MSTQVNPNTNPTTQAYAELQKAYDHFNGALFAGLLPPCLITLQRRSAAVMGYYSKGRFVSNHLPGRTTDEIALNPIHFKGRDVTQVLQTLVHEMCHLWQYHFGKPSRTGYHNREWAAKMIAIGLHPSSTGKPGGNIVGQHMADYVIEGGAFHHAVQHLANARFRISWYDRLAEFLVVIQPHPHAGQLAPIPLPPTRPPTCIKYSCPHCGLNAWAKPRATLICGTHHLRMEPQCACTPRSATAPPPSIAHLRHSVLHTTGPEYRHA